MRRDLLLTALIFTAVGFLAGALYTRHAGEPGPTPNPVSASMPAESDVGLPEGHPPIDLAQRWRELEQRVQANPQDAAAALEFANFLYDLERWEEAVFWYRRTLELEPKNTDARTDLATCYYHLRRYDEAIADYSLALELQPNKPQALYGLALARLEGKQDVAGARQLYDQLRRNHPDFPGVELLAQQLEPRRERR
ncbi:MAG: tetratricopeptide repeat protein [Acidobacteria bacterium]|nr:tetratricopeptide repeat protein [Acidobacteriota bacterium]